MQAAHKPPAVSPDMIPKIAIHSAKTRLNATLLLVALLVTPCFSFAQAKLVQTPYREPHVVFDFYFDDPAKINAALYWIRALINPLTEAPYDMAPELMSIKAVIHGTEIVTLAKKNYDKYRDAVERMRYYAGL